MGTDELHACLPHQRPPPAHGYSISFRTRTICTPSRHLLSLPQNVRRLTCLKLKSRLSSCCLFPSSVPHPTFTGLFAHLRCSRWLSKAACPLSTLPSASVFPGSACTVSPVRIVRFTLTIGHSDFQAGIQACTSHECSALDRMLCSGRVQHAHQLR